MEPCWGLLGSQTYRLLRDARCGWLREVRLGPVPSTLHHPFGCPMPTSLHTRCLSVDGGSPMPTRLHRKCPLVEGGIIPIPASLHTRCLSADGGNFIPTSWYLWFMYPSVEESRVPMPTRLCPSVEGGIVIPASWYLWFMYPSADDETIIFPFPIPTGQPTGCFPVDGGISG